MAVATYLLHNDRTDEFYVGSTGDVERRLRDHQRMLESGRHENRRLQAAYNRDPGFRAIVAEMDDRETALDLEQSFLDEFQGTPLLLNRSQDARYCCVEHTPESREKLRQAALGRRPSPDVVEKLRLANLRRYAEMPDDERRRIAEKVSAANKGVPKTAEHRQRLSESKTGVSLSEPHKANIARSMEGREFSSEHRDSLSLNHHRLTPVLVDGVEYPSLATAAKALNVTPATVRGRILSKNANYSEYQYKG